MPVIMYALSVFLNVPGREEDEEEEWSIEGVYESNIYNSRMGIRFPQDYIYI